MTFASPITLAHTPILETERLILRRRSVPFDPENARSISLYTEAQLIQATVDGIPGTRTRGIDNWTMTIWRR